MTQNQVPAPDLNRLSNTESASSPLENIQSSDARQELKSSKTDNQQKLKSDENVTYPDKTDRIRAWTDLIKSASTFIWIGVVLIIVLQLWGNFAVSSIRSTTRDNAKTITVIIPETKRSQISADIASALGKALENSRISASENLEQWENEVMHRVDHPFLDWYYNYFTQLGIGIKGIWVNISSSSDEDKREKLIEGFQREFAKQVLQPPLMQIQMERFTREAVDTYVSKANEDLAGVQSKYKVPQADWENFLEGLGGVTYNTGGNEQNISLRALSRGTGYVATAGLMKAVTVIGTKKVVTATVSKATSKAVTKVATKTATKVLTEGGGELAVGILGLELLNPIAGLGILAWDVWDHYHTVKVERPILRENLERYMNEVKDCLLNDKEYGILSTINKFHDGIMDNLESKSLVSP
jgi:hypothetical protein